MAEAAARQMRTLAAYQTFEYYTNPPAEALASLVADLAPMPNARVFFTSGGGSDAIETAGKLARAYWSAVGEPQKRQIVSRQHAYHGMNAYGTSLSGIEVLKTAIRRTNQQVAVVAVSRQSPVAPHVGLALTALNH